MERPMKVTLIGIFSIVVFVGFASLFVYYMSSVDIGRPTINKKKITDV